MPSSGNLLFTAISFALYEHLEIWMLPQSLSAETSKQKLMLLFIHA